MYLLISQKDKRKLRNVTLLIVYAIFSFYFLLNGSGHFDEWSSSWSFTTVIYLVGVSLFLIVSEKLPKKSEEFIDKELETPITKQLIGFALAFPICTILFIIIKDLGLFFTDVQNMPLYLIPATIVYQLVIVCCSEELIFRGIIFRYLYIYHWSIAWIGSSLIFAFFHFAVYQGSIEKMMLAFLIGLVLAWAMDRWNIGVCIGIHFAWNCFVLGITIL